MATTLDALPRELAHWSLAAAAHHHGHPTTTTTTTGTTTGTTMPMTPPHTDRLHGRWVEQPPQTHTNYNNNNNNNFLHGHTTAHVNARHGQLLTPPDDTPPLDVPMDAAYEPPLPLAPAFASHAHTHAHAPPPPPHRADDERRRGNIEFENAIVDLKQEGQDDAKRAAAHRVADVRRVHAEAARDDSSLPKRNSPRAALHPPPPRAQRRHARAARLRVPRRRRGADDGE
ncbi:hypothetical protein B0H11DRAFT_333437 [Mycena galericulata]|nr:hypothetical protein B0H11DRAFT_333437 [Mycena galericulata]